MKRFELQIGVFIDAENLEDMWERFRSAGLHDLLNQIDAEDGYESEVVGESSYEDYWSQLMFFPR